MNATRFAQDALGEDRTKGIRLEEVVTMPEGDSWIITLSMIDPDAHDDLLNKWEGFITSKDKRFYKSFTVRKDTGEVVSMKIRELADA